MGNALVGVYSSPKTSSAMDGSGVERSLVAGVVTRQWRVARSEGARRGGGLWSEAECRGGRACDCGPGV